MARVPSYDSLQVNPSVNPEVKIGAPEIQNFAAAQNEKLGQGMVNFGNGLARIAYHMDQTRVAEGVDALRGYGLDLTFATKDQAGPDKPIGFTQIRGKDALEPSQDSRESLSDSYTTRFMAKADSIAEGMGNDAQRSAFMARAKEFATTFKGQVDQHVAKEYSTYSLSVANGTIATRSNEMAYMFDNPQAIDEAINGKYSTTADGQKILVDKGIRQAAYDAAHSAGRTGEAKEIALKSVSNGLKSAMLAAVEAGQPQVADKLLKQYGNAEHMEANDMLQVRGVITKQTDAKVASDLSFKIMKDAAPRMVTSDIDRAFNLAMVPTESGGRQFDKDGKPLTSVKGATGIAQVMPATGPEAAKLAGLPWNEELFNRKKTGDPVKDKEATDYSLALGKAYFTKQVHDFGSDIYKSFAAYNAGPGATREAIKLADKSQAELAKAAPAFEERLKAFNENPNRTEAEKKSLEAEKARLDDLGKKVNWLGNLPAETQAYVAKNVKLYSTGGGQYERPTLQELHAQVRNDPNINTPQRLQTALAEVTRQYEDYTKAIKQHEDESVTTVMRQLVQNGGKWNQLPMGALSNVPPKEVDNLMAFAGRISKGVNETNPAVYQKLSDETYLRSLSDDDFFKTRMELSDSDFKHFAGLRGKKSGEGDVDAAAVNQRLNTLLSTVGIDPTPSEKDKEAVMRVGAIRKTVMEQIIRQQNAAGKKFQDADISKAIDKLFAETRNYQDTFVGIPLVTKGKQRLLTMEESDLDGDVKSAIKKDYKSKGIDNPTNGEILSSYWAMKLSKK